MNPSREVDKKNKSKKNDGKNNVLGDT